MDYQQFLAKKTLIAKSQGIDIDPATINPVLFPFQRDIVKWATHKGRAAIFASTGLGKTVMQVEWARLMNVPTLIIAPLSVARQTVNEAQHLLGLEVRYVRDQSQIEAGHNLYITNYEMVEHFDAAAFGAVVLDESSILKSLDGKTKALLTEMFADTPYRLCCTATPAPNDIMEIANHSEFLGYLRRLEMQAVFFRYSASANKTKVDAWRLKKHAVTSFYQWLASWSMAVTLPSDIGDYDDNGYILPALNVIPQIIDTHYAPEGMLPGFDVGAVSAIEARHIRKQTLSDRVTKTLELVNADSDSQWLLWVGLNDEGDTLEKLIPDAVQVKGSQSPEKKSELIEAWQDGKYRVLITKTKITGFGMNFQNAHNMAFVGIDFSWESYFQAIRRCWRFGQTHEVNVHIITSNQEKVVIDTLFRKEKEAVKMINELIRHTKTFSQEELHNMRPKLFDYHEADARGQGWTMWLGDSAERMAAIPDNSVDLSVYSPPFKELFVYSATERDLGNCLSSEEFFEQYSFIIRENLRITKPGRIACVHTQDLRSYKGFDGFVGRKDFSGDVIEAYQKAGWEYWHRITINKDPQVQAIRLKDSRLLFVTLSKDSVQLAGGYADYVLVFKKPGENEVQVKPDVTPEEWIQWAHPVWNDIRETDVLPVVQAKANDDEKHMCPLQLPVIERCIRLWSNTGELVFSPFGGIGSEGYEAIRLGRRYHGIELKPEYYNVALRNLQNAENLRGFDLFAWADANAE